MNLVLDIIVSVAIKMNKKRYKKWSHRQRLNKIRVMKRYAREAYSMRYAELVQAYVKCKFGKTVFSSVPPGFWDDVFEDLEDDDIELSWSIGGEL